MSHKKLSPFIVKVSVVGYFPLVGLLVCGRPTDQLTLGYILLLLLLFYFVESFHPIQELRCSFHL